MGYIDVSPGGTRCGWIGNDPAGSGLTGAWFGKLYIGGASASVAPFVVNSSGQLSISLTSANAGATPFQLNLNGVTTTIANGYNSTQGTYAGIAVTQNSTGAQSLTMYNGFAALNASSALMAYMGSVGTGVGQVRLQNPSSGASVEFDAMTVLAASASAGASMPVTFSGNYWIIQLNGTTYKVPLCNN